jgi:cytosine/adenosine deaminase-related metal-dependent hydrolase
VFVHAASVTHADVSRTRDRIARLSAVAGPSTTIAFGFALNDRDDLDLSAEAMSLARELGLRIHVHVHARASGTGMVAALHGRGLLGHDVTLVHHTGLDEADLGAIATSGASMSFAPQSEMAEGRGAPPIQGLIDHGIRPGLGVDRELLAPGDLFAQMRAAISMQHAVVFDRKLAGKGALPRLLSTRDVIRYATVDGARVAGLGEVAGSLEAGLQADIVMLRTDRPNIYPINDPIGAVVWGMDTSNIDRVFVGGRAVVRDGVLDADLDEVSRAASRARDRMVAASRLVGAAQRGGPA